MMLGTLKALDRQLLTATGAQADKLQRIYDGRLAALAAWTPSTPREVVQACAIARHMLDHVQELEGEALDILREAVADVARRARARDLGAARAMELLPYLGAFAGLDPAHEAYEVAVLAAIGRAASLPLRWSL